MSTGLGKFLDAIDAAAEQEVAEEIDLDDCPDEFLVSHPAQVLALHICSTT